ncbi:MULTISPECIES: RNA polymerase sigma factor [unclassified Tenacibaculum]|uniref:RNA polymerase sigma factor n=1 Tax=unclassified Tenacibaculum TaxID=2635139 RepID=UPI001F273550|nr:MULTISPECIES: RNA polymerase sigma factor [unclassified Tenacibaculum]MCF2876233.1 RNA polymerase sigma factor [Tenacibaculum sp. Cn5-1]MCF2936308.1 RNA polymerase sigma factor [Tenacibaculum sp. Cn5-34]MCG7511651.1 RNA polymerase sigma factor [Tenacibaculum sp. Cn5-46]
MTDEITLIEQLQDQKTREVAFKHLISQYKERLYWHIRKIVISHDDADDVLQNTFIKIFKSINNFKGNSKLYSWMYRIATNEAITFINKKAKERNIDITDYQHQLVSNLDSDNWFSGDEIQLVLQKAIATLPQKQQLVFNMKYFDEMKYDQISEVLETSVGALKASYHIAVKKIEQFIKNYN